MFPVSRGLFLLVLHSTFLTETTRVMSPLQTDTHTHAWTQDFIEKNRWRRHGHKQAKSVCMRVVENTRRDLAKSGHKE